ncbi:MAG: YdcH family protein [Roseobacter sp.]
MSVYAHVEQLKRKHESLSDAVEAAQRAPSTDNFEIADLKKQKLRLKEEITRLSS